MENKRILEDVLEVDNLSEIVAHYETFYQVALSSLVHFSSGYDPAESTTRMQKFSLRIDFDSMIEDVIQSAWHVKDQGQILRALKKLAAERAVDYLLDADDEILNKNIFHDLAIESIENSTFYTPEMEKIIHDSMPIKMSAWKQTINTDSLEEAREKVLRRMLFTRHMHDSARHRKRT